jgi:hypothetical protein
VEQGVHPHHAGHLVHRLPSAEVSTHYAAQPETLAGKFSRKDLRIRGGAITDA